MINTQTQIGLLLAMPGCAVRLPNGLASWRIHLKKNGARGPGVVQVQVQVFGDDLLAAERILSAH